MPAPAFWANRAAIPSSVRVGASGVDPLALLVEHGAAVIGMTNAARILSASKR